MEHNDTFESHVRRFHAALEQFNQAAINAELMDDSLEKDEATMALVDIANELREVEKLIRLEMLEVQALRRMYDRS